MRKILKGVIVVDKVTFIKIANNCRGYEANSNPCPTMTSSLAPDGDEKSCANCSHLYKNRCQFDLMETVLDQISTR